MSFSGSCNAPEFEEITSSFAKHYEQADPKLDIFNILKVVLFCSYNDLLGENHNNFIKIQQFKTNRPVNTCALGNASKIY